MAIEFQKTIKVGKFVDAERPTWQELADRQLHATLGDRYYRAAAMNAAQKEEKTHA